MVYPPEKRTFQELHVMLKDFIKRDHERETTMQIRNLAMALPADAGPEIHRQGKGGGKSSGTGICGEWKSIACIQALSSASSSIPRARKVRCRNLLTMPRLVGLMHMVAVDNGSKAIGSNSSSGPTSLRSQPTPNEYSCNL